MLDFILSNEDSLLRDLDLISAMELEEKKTHLNMEKYHFS